MSGSSEKLPDAATWQSTSSGLTTKDTKGHKGVDWMILFRIFAGLHDFA